MSRKPKALSPPPPTPQAPSRRGPEAAARAGGFRRIAGVDEAGRGPWAGPVVAAAVILRASVLPVRIDDSKRLTRGQRERAFRVIRERAEVGVGIVCADEIDQWNILRASLLAMRLAIQDLPRPPDIVLVDGSVPPAVSLPCWPLVHGDQRSYVIACASIIAKVFRDRLMAFYHELSPGYAFNQHNGYGTAVHAARLRQFGPSVFHRMSFQPVRAVAMTQPVARWSDGEQPRHLAPSLAASSGVPT
ncbi:MAG: ribonuclease HII [Candidatus Omnitrophica bacterium]|nr:ribonuclease HII [Candidatus Omnitrophota bacterium]